MSITLFMPQPITPPSVAPISESARTKSTPPPLRLTTPLYIIHEALMAMQILTIKK